MTTLHDSDFPTNQTTIVGRLGSFPSYRDSKDRRPLKMITRRCDFGLSTRFVVSLETPFGEPFDLLMEANSATQGLAALEAATIGDYIAVEGTLAMGSDTDRRYVVGESDGRRVRDMIVQVSSIRTPPPDERVTLASACIQGSVAEPVTFIRHPKLRSIEFGRALVRTTVGPFFLHYDVACVISTQHDAAGYLYNNANTLQLRGQLIRLMTPQFGAAVDQAIDRLQQEWAAEKQALAAAPAEQLLAAQQRYRSRRDSLLVQPRTYMLVDTVTPLGNAKSISYGEARRHRRAHVRALRNADTGAAPPMSQSRPGSFGFIPPEE
jgi:hypothetical protein